MLSIKYFFAAILIFALAESKAQIIRGQIFDSETDSVVAFANVYFNSSYQGTTTDQNGKFALDTKGFAGQGITISCIGYESWVLEDYLVENFYKIYLIPSSFVLKEIEVRADDWPQSKKIKRFKREFLGTSENATKCTIENINDIYLAYDKSSKTLFAYCDKPLIIKNENLGYKITYFLEEFEWNEQHLYYTGNFFFKEDTALLARERDSIYQRRLMTYTGSRMHFIRDLWRGDSQNSNFILTKAGSYEIKNWGLIQEQSNENIKYLLPGPEIRIRYLYDNSFISFTQNEKTLLTEYGYFDPRYISWSGAIAEQRVGDLLPYEYYP